MGRKSKLKQTRMQNKMSRDEAQSVAGKKILFNLNDHYTMHNHIIAQNLAASGRGASDNFFFVIDANTGGLAKIMPDRSGATTLAAYENTSQSRNVRSRTLFAVGICVDATSTASVLNAYSVIAEFVPCDTAKEIHGVISAFINGLSAGHKFILLKDDLGDLNICLHPDTISIAVAADDASKMTK